MSDRQQWEYLFLEMCHPRVRDLAIGLNMHGRDGWEMVQAVQVDNGVTAILKRPRLPPSPPEG